MTITNALAKEAIRLTQERLDALPYAERCCAGCKGWFVDTEATPRVVACDECNNLRANYIDHMNASHGIGDGSTGDSQVSDDDCAALPAARKALARVVCGRVKSPALRRALMRENTVMLAIEDARRWLESARTGLVGLAARYNLTLPVLADELQKIARERVDGADARLEAALDALAGGAS